MTQPPFSNIGIRLSAFVKAMCHSCAPVCINVVNMRLFLRGIEEVELK